MSVTLVTSHGDITIELFYRETPTTDSADVLEKLARGKNSTCRNFIELSRGGYYDGVLFHRLIPEFMVQTGDPYGDGTGGESIYGPTFDDEIVARLGHDQMGVVSMANAGRNTNSSQFFITFKPCPHLDGKHTVFGRVSEGLGVIEEIQLVKIDKKKRPIKPIKIFTAHVTRDPWEGQPLPAGAEVPDKPLTSGKKSKGKKLGGKVKEQCAVQ